MMRSTPSSSGSSARGVGGTAPAEATKPSPPAQPKKPAPAYNVTVLFGAAPVGTPPQGPPLTTYPKLKRLTPLPSVQRALVVFAGVTAGGKSATFTLVGEVILHGSATCFPNASQCQAIELKPGQAEQLEYVPSSGPPVTYELQVAAISSAKATTASAARTLRGVSLAGRELLRRAGRLTLPGLRYSAAKGVLVFTAKAGVAHRARALWPPRHGD